jgi:hypothetical protein
VVASGSLGRRVPASCVRRRIAEKIGEVALSAGEREVAAGAAWRGGAGRGLGAGTGRR